MRRAAALAVLALALAPAERPALAYCRTSSCAPPGSKTAVTGQTCTPSQTGDCGTPIAWPNPCVTWSLEKNASKQVSFSEAEAILEKAFSSWVSASCSGGGTPRIKVTEADATSCTKHEYNQSAGNANAIIFRDDAWPYEGSGNTLALTTVTYNIDNGQIYDADMELNSAEVHFTTGDTQVDTDLLSVVTHETGHFLGLGHSADAEATMFPAYAPGSTKLRDLSVDDIDGICAVYPPGDAIPSSCDATPRHGFSTLCAAEQAASSTSSGGDTSSSGCCAVAPGSATGHGGLAGVAASLGALLLAARRKRRAGPARG